MSYGAHVFSLLLIILCTLTLMLLSFLETVKNVPSARKNISNKFIIES